MGKKEKLIARLKSKPRDFTFEEADSLLTALGMKKSNKGRTSGSRVEYVLGGIKIQLHKPHPRKELPIYRIVLLIDELSEKGLI